MAINARSASESLALFGLKNDGPIGKGGLGASRQAITTPQEVAATIEGVTTADQLVTTSKPIKAKERKAVANKEQSVANMPEVSRTDVANKTRQQRYNETHAEDRKAKARERMAKKRAEQKGKQ